jgi:hypothetical protein
MTDIKKFRKMMGMFNGPLDGRIRASIIARAVVDAKDHDQLYVILKITGFDLDRSTFPYSVPDICGFRNKFIALNHNINIPKSIRE